MTPTPGGGGGESVFHGRKKIMDPFTFFPRGFPIGEGGKKKGKNVSISTLRSTPRMLFIERPRTTLGIRADFGFAWSINIIRSDTPTFPAPISGQVLRVTKEEGAACVNGKNTPLERASGSIRMLYRNEGMRRAVSGTAD